MAEPSSHFPGLPLDSLELPQATLRLALPSSHQMKTLHMKQVTHRYTPSDGEFSHYWYSTEKRHPQWKELEL